jgi:hypothetical protein
MKNINDYAPYVAALKEESDCKAKLGEVERDLAFRRTTAYEASRTAGFSNLDAALNHLATDDKSLETLSRQIVVLKKTLLELERKVNSARREFIIEYCKLHQAKFTELEKGVIMAWLNFQQKLLEFKSFYEDVAMLTFHEPRFSKLNQSVDFVRHLPDAYSQADINFFKELRSGGVVIPEPISKAMTLPH